MSGHWHLKALSSLIYNLNNTKATRNCLFYGQEDSQRLIPLHYLEREQDLNEMRVKDCLMEQVRLRCEFPEAPQSC